MIRMIIADDEMVIIRGLQKLLDWKRYGIEIVGVYYDGISALDGILVQKPDIALLDVAMPGRTGIEILKKLQGFKHDTKVIFISGYQNFTYAQEALKYGAVDYILKPVIEEELENALGKCIALIKKEQNEPLYSGQLDVDDSKEMYEWTKEYMGCGETMAYLPATIRIFYEPDEKDAERELIRFSIYAYLEQLVTEDRGVLFEKRGRFVVVLKEADKSKGKDFLYGIKDKVEQERQRKIGIVIGNVVFSMSQIPEQYQICQEKERYFFFRDNFGGYLLDVEEPVFRRTVEQQEIQKSNEAIYEALIQQSDSALQKELQHFFHIVCILSDGRKEDACFHLCTGVRDMEKKFHLANMPGLGVEIRNLLDESRKMEDYGMLKRYFSDIYGRYREQVNGLARGKEKTELARAKEYIETHYQENISLEILAREVHMNPYYFSAYFKKGTGKNFKDYLNEVRLKHALALLVTTDKLSYEISEEVGYRDSRVFSDKFQKYYGETPSNYRKKMKKREKREEE